MLPCKMNPSPCNLTMFERPARELVRPVVAVVKLASNQIWHNKAYAAQRPPSLYLFSRVEFGETMIFYV